MAPMYQGQTSTSTFKMGFDVTYKNFSSDYEYSEVIITPYLCNTKGVQRYQHQWTNSFHITNAGLAEKIVHYNGPAASNYLPNSAADSNVERLGYMTMQANKWYQWGAPCKFTVKNDGASRQIGVYLQCPGVAPKYCPENGKYLYTTPIAFPTYAVQPSQHVGLGGTFNEDTRVMTYNWTVPANSTTAYKMLYRTFHYADGTSKSGFFMKSALTVDATKILNSDAPLKEVIPADVTSIKWQMINYSSTGHLIKSNEHTAITDSECKVWIKTAKGWVKAIPWIKTPDGWKKATKTYVHIGNEWRTLIM